MILTSEMISLFFVCFYTSLLKSLLKIHAYITHVFIDVIKPLVESEINNLDLSVDLVFLLKAL